ncbi:MAG TPA: MscL family protein, partial [Propionicimonas sp.]|nr:MscL family protein [Propionicimonas sp.]
MKGFKDFIMRGNLVELAVAVIIATSLGTVVTTFTKIVLDIIGLIGGNPNF